VSRSFLVTGAHGCIGAWVTTELARAGEDVTTFDLSTDPRRLALLLEPDELAAVPHVAGDISDL
jgi:UDP-glucuronate 4-epimerase